MPNDDAEAAKIRVFLVDDHPIVRRGLRVLIDGQADMEVVGEAADGAGAISGVLEIEPDVALVDISMPGLGGIEATHRIRQERPRVKVVAMSAHEGGGYAQRMFAAGATGYVVKRAAAEEMLEAIRAVAGGWSYFDPAVTSISTEESTAPASAPNPVTEQLSAREIDVVRLLAQGYGIKEIAARLGIGGRSVETYKNRAMDKLGLRSRADIVRFAMKRGWLE